jgi:hypothetical protein
LGGFDVLGLAISWALASAVVEPTVSIDGQALKAARAFTIRAGSGTEVQFATAPVECSKVKSGYALMEGDVPLVVTLASTGAQWRVVEVVFEHVRIRLKDDESRASRARVSAAEVEIHLAQTIRFRSPHRVVVDGTFAVTVCGSVALRGAATALAEASVSHRIRDVTRAVPCWRKVIIGDDGAASEPSPRNAQS